MQVKKKSSKQQKSKKMPGLWSLGGLVLIGLLLFVFRGWLRVTVIPRVMKPFYANALQATYEDQANSLQKPYALLGFHNITGVSTKCSMQQAESFHTEIDCTSEQQAYLKLPSNASGIALEQAHAKQLQHLLLADGWNGGGNGVTEAGLIDGTVHGIDYSPDAFYEKVVGDDDCILDTYIAYANPQPPAIMVRFTCDRTVNILGAPKDEVYYSSRGMVP